MVPWILGAGTVAAILLTRPAKVLARGPSAGLVPVGNLSSPFGMRQLPGEELKMHQGIDVAAPVGTEIRAAQPGIVVDVAPNGARTGYGNTVIVEHPGGALTLYAHMDRFGPGVRIGKALERGDVVGFVGNTHAPSKTFMAPHLHFEVLKGKVLWQGKIVVNAQTPMREDPKTWLRKKSVALAA